MGVSGSGNQALFLLQERAWVRGWGGGVGCFSVPVDTTHKAGPASVHVAMLSVEKAVCKVSVSQ